MLNKKITYTVQNFSYFYMCSISVSANFKSANTFASISALFSEARRRETTRKTET
jgi:predicted transcriptional regulator